MAEAVNPLEPSPLDSILSQTLASIRLLQHPTVTKKTESILSELGELLHSFEPVVVAPVVVAPVATGTTVPVVAGTAPVVAGTAPVVAGTTPVVAGTTASGATTTNAPLTSGTTATGALGTAHLRVRSEPKLIGTVKLGVKEVVLTTGNAGPLLLNIKFAAPEQKFTTAITPGASGRFAFATNEFLINVDPTNNVRDIFIEVIENGVVLGETRVTLYDAYRPSGLAAAQPILIHSTKSRIGEMLLTSSFDGKVQKR